MYCASGIQEISSGIWDRLDNPESPSILSISGWLAANIGRLNILIESDFCANSGYISPALCNQEQIIFELIYLNYYYEKKIRTSINNIIDTGSALDWIEVREGDSVIKRNNRNEVLKTYKTLKDDISKELNELAGLYKMNFAKPIQVVGNDAPY